MGRATPHCDAMSESSGFTDLCIVTAVDVEFKIGVDILSGKSPEVGRTLVSTGAGQAIVSPTSSEKSHIKICRGLFGGRRITILQSGMGAVGFAERLANHLMNDRYDALIVVGLAGGLDPKLRVGDAVLYDICYDARAIDFTRHEWPDREQVAAIASNGPLSGFLRAALTRSDLSFVRASGITLGRIVTEAKEKLALGAHYGAAAVDMETYEALSACARRGLPAIALRVISDEAGRDIPDFNRVYNADGRINGWRMLGAMTARPSATFRLLLTVRHALQSLKASLQAAMDV
jgi:adenosylhomocysteine nucleosidase